MLQAQQQRARALFSSLVDIFALTVCKPRARRLAFLLYRSSRYIMLAAGDLSGFEGHEVPVQSEVEVPAPGTPVVLFTDVVLSSDAQALLALPPIYASLRPSQKPSLPRLKQARIPRLRTLVSAPPRRVRSLWTGC